MKKTLIASAMLGALFAGSAMAADMPLKAPVVRAPAPVYNWTGFYVGGGGGYGMWNADTTVVADPLAIGFASGALTQSVTNGGRGWFGTVTAGFDYQFTDHIVGGVFGDYDFASLKGTLSSGVATSFFNTLGGSEKENSAWAVGGRVGWLIAPNVLTYLTGGYTEARFAGFAVDNLTGFLPLPIATGFFTQAHTYRGFFLGSGVEAQLSLLGSGWFVRTEYRYADYRSATLPVQTATGAIASLIGVPFDLSVRPVVQTVRTELVYKFNWGSPSVVAKY